MATPGTRIRDGMKELKELRDRKTVAPRWSCTALQAGAQARCADTPLWIQKLPADSFDWSSQWPSAPLRESWCHA
jgi:hypothetical protein